MGDVGVSVIRKETEDDSKYIFNSSHHNKPEI